jgi:virginiamycin B lyase
VTDFNNDVLWRYDIPTDTFTSFETATPDENTDPLDVTVAPDGIVWFVEGDGRIGRLDPAVADNPATPAHENITQIDVAGFPREISVASDGFIWFTEQFPPSAVGRINPATNAVALFPADGQPLGIAPAAGGSMWFSRFTGGNIVRISPTGAITAQSKVVKGSGPSGITVAPDGNPWFTMLDSNKIANLQLR